MFGRKELRFFLLLSPALLAVVLFFAVPCLYAFYLSLRDYNLMVGRDEFIGLANYASALSDGGFLRSIVRNIIYTAGVVSVNLVLGMAMALTVARGGRIAALLTGVIILPMLLIPSASAMLWRYMYSMDFGMANHLLAALGLDRHAWLGSTRTALLAVMLADIWSWTPWVFLVLLAGLRTLPKAPFEAARIDGASAFQVFRYITLPLMAPIIFIAVTLKAVDTFKAFVYPWVMTGGGPGEASHIINTFIYQTAFTHMDYGYATAMAVIDLGLLTVGFILIMRVIRRRRLIEQ